MNVGTILSMAGGLGLFMFGMRLMSQAIEKAAGAKLRRILEIFTTNRFTGMLVGIFFTAATQSSSACTAMVVSFVNAGLMNLYQAAGVIFGVNIGTTVTSQLAAFNFSAAAPIILLVGVIVLMAAKKEQTKQIGEVIIGFGILFIGLETMKSAMAVVKESESVRNMLSSLTNPILAGLIGFLFTAAIQSSSVIVSIVLMMAQQELLGFDICLYIIVGTTIGGTMAALLASLSGKREAKRAALIHFLMNILSAGVLFIVFALAINPVIDGLMYISRGNYGRFVANAHVAIKLFQVGISLPFLKPLVNLSCLIVRGENQNAGYRDAGQLKFIGHKAVYNPTTAVVEVIKELERMASLAKENLNRAMNALITLDREEINEVYAVEKNINYISREITDYLVRINQTNLPIEDLKRIGALFYIVNDIEMIGDHAENMADAAMMRIDNGAQISEQARKELTELLDMVNTIFQYAIEMFSGRDETHMKDIIELEDEIDKKEKELLHKHIDRLTKGECTPEAGMIFSGVASGLERVSDHATNIAFSIVENNRKINEEEG